MKFSNDAENNNSKNTIISALSELPVFAGHREFLDKIMCFFKLYTYGKNHVIQEEGTQPLEIFWIIEGTCNSVKIVPFVERTIKSKTTMRAFVPNEKLAGDENLVKLQLKTQELVAGDFFPTFPLLGNNPQTIKYLGASSIAKELYHDFYSKLKVDDPRTYCSSSIITDSVVMVAAIQFNDFIQIVPSDILFSLVVQPSLHTFPLEQLQNQYLEQRQWKSHKKAILNQFHK